MKKWQWIALLSIWGVLVAVLVGAATMDGRDSGLAFHTSYSWALVADSKPLYFGWDSDVNITWDGDSLDIEPVSDGTALNIGAAGATFDVTLFGTEIKTASAVSLTSPTVNFSVDGMNLIVLNSDGNQTTHVPTGGTLYQVIIILAGAGSNTMQFDDGTSTILGGNKTLTEGQGDVLVLMCVDADGDEWVCVSDQSGN